jgi:hypothetical protein
MIEVSSGKFLLQNHKRHGDNIEINHIGMGVEDGRWAELVLGHAATISQSVQRQATGWTTWVHFPVAARYLSLHHVVQTGSDDHPVSYLTGTVGSFAGYKADGA